MSVNICDIDRNYFLGRHRRGVPAFRRCIPLPSSVWEQIVVSSSPLPSNQPLLHLLSRTCSIMVSTDQTSRCNFPEDYCVCCSSVAKKIPAVFGSSFFDFPVMCVLADILRVCLEIEGVWTDHNRLLLDTYLFNSSPQKVL